MAASEILPEWSAEPFTWSECLPDCETGDLARGVPDGPDDGTLASWAVVASLPLASEIVPPALRHFDVLNLRQTNPYSCKATFNPTYQEGPDREPRREHGFTFSLVLTGRSCHGENCGRRAD